MGRTTSDRNRLMYREWRLEGDTHDEAINRIPEERREDFLKDLHKTPIESHFGMKDKHFFITITAFGVLTAILAALC